MNVEPPETLVIVESIVYKSNGFAISRDDRYFILAPIIPYPFYKFVKKY
jgi:hypothetical protein